MHGIWPFVYKLRQLRTQTKTISAIKSYVTPKYLDRSQPALHRPQHLVKNGLRFPQRAGTGPGPPPPLRVSLPYTFGVLHTAPVAGPLPPWWFRWLVVGCQRGVVGVAQAVAAFSVKARSPVTAASPSSSTKPVGFAVAIQGISCHSVSRR